MSSSFDFLGVETATDGRCQLCSRKRLVVRVTIDRQPYAFCHQHEHRGLFLQRGQANGWPALRIEGVTGIYAIDSDVGAYFLTAICGTDERVVELLDALDEYEQKKAS